MNFPLLDEKPEQDNGTIELVNMKKNEEGVIEEVDERTGHWAWKKTLDNEVNYIGLTGDVRFKRLRSGTMRIKQFSTISIYSPNLDRRLPLLVQQVQEKQPLRI